MWGQLGPTRQLILPQGMTGDQSEIGLVRTEKSSTIIAEPSAPRPDAQNSATNTLRAMSMTMAG